MIVDRPPPVEVGDRELVLTTLLRLAPVSVMYTVSVETIVMWTIRVEVMVVGTTRVETTVVVLGRSWVVTVWAGGHVGMPPRVVVVAVTKMVAVVVTRQMDAVGKDAGIVVIGSEVSQLPKAGLQPSPQ